MSNAKKSKAQAGLEYLITYGWALIAIATIIGVLVFAAGGGINTASCTTFLSLACKGIAAEGGTLVMVLQNATGQKITINPFTGICLNGKCGYASIIYRGQTYGDEEITIGQGEEFTVQGYGMAATKQISITYKEESTGLEKTAESGMATGTKENPEPPQEITDCTQLQAIQSSPGKDYILMNNISCLGFDFTPIGTFTGKLYGQGHKIQNLAIELDLDDVGLFGNITGGSVENLTLQDFSIIGRGATAGLVGSISNGTISNINVTNSRITGSNGSLIGGIAGEVYGNSTISNTNITGSYIGGGRAVGGIAGKFYGNSTISNTNITNSDITGFAGVGGIVGWQQGGSAISSANITNSTTIIGTNDVGGIVGWQVNGTISYSSSSATRICTTNCGDCIECYNCAGSRTDGTITNSTCT